MLDQLQEQVTEINSRLGTALQVVPKNPQARYYSFYQLQHNGRPIISTWRSYETMAYHLNTVLQILRLPREDV